MPRRLGLRCPAASPAAWAPWPAVTAPRLVGVLASAAAWHMGSGVGLGVVLYTGHRACTVHLAWPRGGERAVCTFWLLPVRTGQAPQSQALSAAAGFGAFIQQFREWIEKGG